MPKNSARLAREQEAALEARLWYDEPIGPVWPYSESPIVRAEKLRARAEREEQARRKRALKLSLRIQKPTSTAHFVPGRYGSGYHGQFQCHHCGASHVTDRWQHDEFHRRSSPGSGVIMFLETLEALFGTDS